MTIPILSIFIPTYNRVKDLKICINSVLKQSFRNYEIILVDDCSSDNTNNYIKTLKDKRIRKYKNKINLGSKYGDKIMFEKFIYKQAKGKYVAYLCDDDYYYYKDLLRDLISILENNSNLSMSFAGVGQAYPSPFKKLFSPNVPHITYEYVGKSKKIIFAKNVYPEGIIKSDIFFRLFQADPGNRNLALGAAVWKKENLIKSNLNKTNKIKRQMGWWFFISSALLGDVYFLNKPGFISAIHLNTLSFQRTQKEHLLDCLYACDVAFKTKTNKFSKKSIIKLRNNILKSVMFIYLSNKYGNKLSCFARNPLGDISDLFKEEITSKDFINIIKKFKLEIDNKYILSIYLSDFPVIFIKIVHYLFKMYGGVFWWKKVNF